MDPKPIATFQHVLKRFPGRNALFDISLELPRGKIIGLIGPNGSGKSTLLKLLAGLVRQTKGRVLLEGNEVTRRSSITVAYLSEQNGSYPFFTVEETLQFYAGLYADFNYSKALEMLVFMRLELKQKAATLSKGNMTRLKMAVTLSRNAPLILLDEPLTGLDPMIRDSILKSLISFVDLATQTVVITTHEVAEVEPLLDVVIAMKEGRVMKMGYVDDIRSEFGMGLVEWMKEMYADYVYDASMSK